MADKKSITVSEEVYDKLVSHKGKSTWDDYLMRMFEMAFGDKYIQETKLDDFQDDAPGGPLGQVRTSADGELEIALRSSDGHVIAVGSFNAVGPNEKLRIEITEGEVAENST